MAEKIEPAAVRIRGASQVRIGGVHAVGLRAVDADLVDGLSIGRATSVMPQEAAAPAEASPPPAREVPWYRQFWWLIVAAVLTVPAGLAVGYLQHWFGWNK